MKQIKQILLKGESPTLSKTTGEEVPILSDLLRAFSY